MTEAHVEYSMPGMWVREHTVDVPLDWWDRDRGEIEVFVREIVDPDKRGDDLPLLTYLQGGPGGSNPRPTDVSGWMEEALKTYRVVLVDQRGTGLSTPVDARMVADLGDAWAGADHLAKFRADSIVRDLEHVRATRYGDGNGRRSPRATAAGSPSPTSPTPRRPWQPATCAAAFPATR
ncbi:hypothetical protein GCM10029992_48420 [Glycomyces albus]